MFRLQAKVPEVPKCCFGLFQHRDPPDLNKNDVNKMTPLVIVLRSFLILAEDDDDNDDCHDDDDDDDDNDNDNTNDDGFF